jgi:aspartyl-tRNA(Asn)/glutamyl-tRNA(Gln) amidotransferase subunit C
MLSIEEVEKIAKLARLDLTPEEKKKYAEELGRILDYIGQLKEVDTKNIEPTAQVTGLSNVTREDEVFGCDDTAAILKEVPHLEGRGVKVKAVFE